NVIGLRFEFNECCPVVGGKEARARIDAGRPTRTLGMRVLFGHITSFGEPFESNSLSFVGGTPLFSRFFLGGEQDIRGYNIRSISPTAPVVTSNTTQNVRA